MCVFVPVIRECCSALVLRLDGDTKASWQLCAGTALQSAVQQWSTEGATGCAVVSVCVCAVCLMRGELIYVCMCVCPLLFYPIAVTEWIYLCLPLWSELPCHK